ncbi:MAG: winged helix-turn-helix domain-containing protein [Bosea sp.]|uniref:winged helix-turn-helix domain-containing tetratricopeptide repeat protein n=1 Tax=Bosea sp. (in: a-proteobacteria) TaxID=1871050 RepID=UPI001AC2FCBF|nr:winged helix-turn-helix domain-containing tetratricopeptide repeat protein [Bosea sp. (in: a-proteobacteria)]MBN9454371.1 winged helix-turn-helix domain-containing protein [Bosea sp. (in: a-proteobacteria)]
MAKTFAFGPYRLDAGAGILFRGADPVGLGQRAVALLALLVERAGRPVAKQDLFEAAWPAQAIEDSNLTVQIAAIRRTLDAQGGAGWIETLPRRGYRYIGPAVEVDDRDPTTTALIRLALPDRPSIAVLPFANLNGDPEQDHVADGMVDDIVTGLARIKGLFVIARHSTTVYKGRAIDVKQVGHELGVRYVLEGSLRKAGNHVRVGVQMIDASTGTHVWGERYDRDSEDIFALQDEIALSAVGAIAPSIRRAEIDRVKRKRPDSLDAYDLVLRAQADVDSGMPGQVARALQLLERAIELDPDYALAYGNAAMCHHCLFLRAGWQEASREASIRHARLASIHGQDDAAALTLAGFSIGMDGHDRGAALTAFEAALAISPSSALTYILGSVMFGWAGEAERAIAWSERGMRLSPFDPWAFAAFDAQAMSHLLRGRYDEACHAAYRSVQANPAHSITYVQLAAALVKLGRLEEARRAAARVLELHPAFRFSRQFAGVNCAPELADVLDGTLRLAGLPE